MELAVGLRWLYDPEFRYEGYEGSIKDMLQAGARPGWVATLQAM